MARRDISLLNKLIKKNILDTVILGAVSIIIMAIIIFCDTDKTKMIWLAMTALAFYYILYQFSRNELMSSIDKLIDNELKEFQKSSVKILQLSEKQRQLTNNYIDMLENVVHTTKSFKNKALKTREKTQSINSKMLETYEFSGKELKDLQENVTSLQNLKQKVQVIAELIIELTDYVKQIGSTVNIVENISEQTNMLALNAAVEAARAGEYGKGFAVVASEIRKLADESKQATNKITTLVTEIEQTTSSTIVATEDGVKSIETDVKFADNINKDFLSLVNNVKDLSEELSDVLKSSAEQQSITDEVLEVIDSMKQTISESIKNVEENIENIKVFSEISSNIKDNIAN